MGKLKHIKSFEDFINEAYEADVAIENLMYKIMGDIFLENREEILDDIYTTLGMRTVNYAYDDLCNEYPDLLDYKKEFYEAAEKEGYTIMNKDKWNSGIIESYKQNSDVPYTVLCNWFDRYESYCIDNDIEQEFPDVDYIIDEPLMIDIVRNYAQQYGNSRNM